MVCCSCDLLIKPAHFFLRRIAEMATLCAVLLETNGKLFGVSMIMEIKKLLKIFAILT